MNFTLDIPRDDFGALVQPDIRPIKESSQIYRAYGDFSIGVKTGAFTKSQLIVPEGFVTDGASSPRWAWTLTGFGRDGMHRAAAHVHDWLYFNRGGGPFFPHRYSRAFADELFYEMLKAYGIKSWHCRMAYEAVKLAGGRYWHE